MGGHGSVGGGSWGSERSGALRAVAVWPRRHRTWRGGPGRGLVATDDVEGVQAEPRRGRGRRRRRGSTGRRRRDVGELPAVGAQQVEERQRREYDRRAHSSARVVSHAQQIPLALAVADLVDPTARRRGHAGRRRHGPVARARTARRPRQGGRRTRRCRRGEPRPARQAHGDPRPRHDSECGRTPGTDRARGGKPDGRGREGHGSTGAGAEQRQWREQDSGGSGKNEEGGCARRG